MEKFEMTKTRLIAVGTALVVSLLAGCGTTPPAPATAAATAATRDADDLRYSNSWRIEVSEGANSDGEFVFHVTPKGGKTQVITVKVDDGESEDHVARTIKNAFEKQLDTSKYDIEIDDGEDVLVKKDFTEPRFALEIISSTVKSVRLRLQKE
jgi:lipopolysaccharide export LptBFGC system permease protein LptF